MPLDEKGWPGPARWPAADPLGLQERGGGRCTSGAANLWQH